MQSAYIQFEAPRNQPNEHAEFKLRSIFKHLAGRVLELVIPVANPHYEGKFDDVWSWRLECDCDTGIPQREIGINTQGEVIMILPSKANYGYWTDNNLLLNDFRKHFKVSEISKDMFEESWNNFRSQI